MSVAKITELTAEQRDELPIFRQRYFEHGVSCEAADRPRAEAAFARAYRRLGKKPVPVIWVDSPLTACLAFATLKNIGSNSENEILRASLRDSLEASLRASLREGLRDSLWDSLRASLRDSLRDSLWASLGDSLADSLWASLGDRLGDSLWDSLRASLWASLGDRLGDSLRASLRASLVASLRDSLADGLADSLRASLRDSQFETQTTYWWGQQDLYWVAFYKFCAQIGVPYSDKAADGLDIMHEIGLACMWWYPRDGMIIACERPSAIRFDDAKRLHGESSPAIEFRDGWKIYKWHGTTVPAHWIENRPTLTASEVIAHSNVEVRAAGAQIVGWPTMLDELSAETINDSGSDDVGALLAVKLRGLNRPGKFLKAQCPRNGMIVEGVPDVDDFGLPIETALHAQAWRVGLHPSEYKHPEVRT